MTQTKNTRIDQYYELVADFEVLKYELLTFFNLCGCCFMPPWNSEQKDLTKEWKWVKKSKKAILKFLEQEDLENSSDDDVSNDHTWQLEQIKIT